MKHNYPMWEEICGHRAEQAARRQVYRLISISNSHAPRRPRTNAIGSVRDRDYP
jgi:hypothetical protein